MSPEGQERTPGLQSLSGESPAAHLLDGGWVLSLWAAVLCWSPAHCPHGRCPPATQLPGSWNLACGVQHVAIWEVLGTAKRHGLDLWGYRCRKEVEAGSLRVLSNGGSLEIRAAGFCPAALRCLPFRAGWRRPGAWRDRSVSSPALQLYLLPGILQMGLHLTYFPSARAWANYQLKGPLLV